MTDSADRDWWECLDRAEFSRRAAVRQCEMAKSRQAMWVRGATSMSAIAKRYTAPDRLLTRCAGWVHDDQEMWHGV